MREELHPVKLEILDRLGEEEVGVYCHGCGSIIAGASERSLLDEAMLRNIADMHVWNCPAVLWPEDS